MKSFDIFISNTPLPTTCIFSPDSLAIYFGVIIYHSVVILSEDCRLACCFTREDKLYVLSSAYWRCGKTLPQRDVGCVCWYVYTSGVGFCEFALYHDHAFFKEGGVVVDLLYADM